eukprot:CAMPEP_0117861362 /NCGR_PEP_ID=MMETSP0950-20121206/4326_1 /TAXON_ID=44440 /ORGANISM="Chattonella subsalsa, Strain CCMP2191" /LENGTH=155 /DNA_ID=CAMNT_0005711697 /DNA_START=54 /DNA_END=525 /DNA_ORIENTATION=-
MSLTLLVLKVFGGLTSQTVPQIIKRSFALWNGPVNLLIALIAPTILFQKSLVQVVGSTFTGSVVGLYATAAAIRLFRIPQNLGYAALPHQVVLSLSLAASDLVAADAQVTTALALLSAVLGSTWGAVILNKLHINDAVAKGVSVGGAQIYLELQA